MLTPFPSVPVSGKWSIVIVLIFLRLLEVLAFHHGYPASVKLLKLLSTRSMAFSQVPLTLVHLTWLTRGSFKKFLSHFDSLCDTHATNSFPSSLIAWPRSPWMFLPSFPVTLFLEPFSCLFSQTPAVSSPSVSLVPTFMWLTVISDSSPEVQNLLLGSRIIQSATVWIFSFWTFHPTPPVSKSEPTRLLASEIQL